ncbi:unnamed protein product [Mytilus edulis]|uniref:Fucolectin tachylectin-4 pentraxin-1 domain-containing protein n=1 Tax=Mytilus edulis TaxID=6550 RepID=A0A8S3UX13_MYTED|nr:unnamed protein product [Mytilus edulis]
MTSSEKYCSHTNPGDKSSWWVVDLGAIYDISSCGIQVISKFSDFEIFYFLILIIVIVHRKKSQVFKVILVVLLIPPIDCYHLDICWMEEITRKWRTTDVYFIINMIKIKGICMLEQSIMTLVFEVMTRICDVASKYIMDYDCNEECAGDSSQMCGGGWRLSIYSTGIKN